MCSLTGLQLAAILATYLVALAACRKTGSVYCFALVTPSTSEPALLAVQYLLKVGVFQCDGWGIISNVSAEVLLQAHWKAVDGVRANYGIVDTELFVKQVSGPPGFDPSSPHQFLHTGAKHLANTPVFQKVWDKVFELGKWQDYEWTIKLDVDAVPLPLRLHDYLKNRPQKQVSFDPFPGAEIPFMAAGCWHYISPDYWPLAAVGLGPDSSTPWAGLSAITGPCYFAVTTDAIAIGRWLQLRERKAGDEEE